MNTMQKIEAVSAEKSGYEQTLHDLRHSIEQAADAGDIAQVKALQIEVSAVQEFSASCDRRAKKLNDDLIAEQKAALRMENDQFFDQFKAAADRLPPRARKIGQAIANLAKELEAFHADAAEAGEAARHLTRKLRSGSSLDSFKELPTSAAFRDEALGSVVGEELSKAGIFTRLAPFRQVQIALRHCHPPIEQFIETHVGNLTRRVAQVRSMVNAEID